jgi:CheY-like chemotaxis protein
VTSGDASVGRVVGLEPGSPDYRILIVEDQKANWLLLQRLLQSAGFPVKVAMDGAQAVEVFETWRPHFIWMDLRLPVFSGLEATRRIRQLEGGEKVKIVAVTASAFASQRDEVLSAGLDDFLRKPYRPGEMFDCMARHLGVRYVYATAPPVTGGNPPAILRPEQLSVLPAGLREELATALLSLDRERIALGVSRVSQQDAALGSILVRLTDRLAYTPILDALDKCKRKLSKAKTR